MIPIPHEIRKILNSKEAVDLYQEIRNTTGLPGTLGAEQIAIIILINKVVQLEKLTAKL